MLHDRDDERWADCPGYEGLYLVSDRGRVFNPRRGRFLPGAVNGDGYRHVRLTAPGQRTRTLQVHALVLGAFVGPRPPGHVCDHRSGDRLDNALGNLEWVTPGENLRRAYAAGRKRCRLRAGEGHYQAKLTDARVRAVRRRHAAGATARELAGEYGVRPGTIRKVITRERWGHVA